MSTSSSLHLFVSFDYSLLPSFSEKYILKSGGEGEEDKKKEEGHENKVP